MQINIQSTHFEADDTLLKLVSEKLGKLKKINDRIEKCEVLLSKEKNDHKQGFVVEARLLFPKADLFAKEHAESFELAIDRVEDELKKQLIKHKEKMKEPRRGSGEFPEEELLAE